MNINLISYNTNHGKYSNEIAGWLNEKQRNTDIICLQEFPEKSSKGFVKSLKGRKYSSSYYTNFIKSSESYGELILYDSNLFRNVKSRGIDLGQSWIDKKYPGIDGDRSALYLSLNTPNRQLNIATLQLSAFCTNHFRMKQVHRLLAENSALTEGEVSLFVGDFNISSLFGNKGLIALMKRYGYSYLTPKTKLKTHRIFGLYHQVDYAFGKGISVLSAVNHLLEFSDHFPLLLTLTLTAKN